jgi:hypothetical protein
VSVHTLALHPLSIFTADPPARRLSLVPAAAAPTRTEDLTLVVTRTEIGAVSGTCALCWSGPGPLAGSVRQRGVVTDSTRRICSRCLVTLEMLALQFAPRNVAEDPDGDTYLQLCIEPAT